MAVTAAQIDTGVLQDDKQGFPWRKVLMILAFLVPSLVLYSVFVLFPLFQAMRASLYDWNGLGPLTDFIGLDNFRQAYHDKVFRLAFRHNLTILALSLLIQLPLALALSLLISGSMHGRTIFRTVFFLPFILSEVIVGLIWKFLYRPDAGINSMIQAVFPDSDFRPRGWLSDPNIVLYSVFAVLTWKYIGFYIVLYLAGLQGVPSDLKEAARLDGASNFRVAKDVTLPLLTPTIFLSVFLSAVGSLQVFDLVWVMTKGGPINGSETMATYMYTFSFQRFALGYGSAVSVVIFLISFLFALIYVVFGMNRDIEA